MIVIATIKRSWDKDPSPYTVSQYCEGHCELPNNDTPNIDDIVFAKEYTNDFQCDECDAGYWQDFVDDDRDYDE